MPGAPLMLSHDVLMFGVSMIHKAVYQLLCERNIPTSLGMALSPQSGSANLAEGAVRCISPCGVTMELCWAAG